MLYNMLTRHVSLPLLFLESIVVWLQLEADLANIIGHRARLMWCMHQRFFILGNVARRNQNGCMVASMLLIVAFNFFIDGANVYTTQ